MARTKQTARPTSQGVPAHRMMLATKGKGKRVGPFPDAKTVGTRTNMASNKAIEVFLYTGVEVVPKNVTHVKFASTVTEIGPDTFRDCINLIAIELNEGLRVIGYGAFVGCVSLESITLPSTVTEVGDYAISHCRSLREVVLNEGLQTIGTCAFEQCASLISISLPSTVTEIGPNEFRHCPNLIEVVLNEGLLVIGGGAFGGCVSLNSITIPSTITVLGDCAFFGCIELREVVLNEGIQTIGTWAFQGCMSLESLKFPFILTRWDDICLEGQTSIENEINDMHGVERNGGDILISIEPQNWETCRESLDRICRLITYYELKEATAIIEMALWKAKIEEEGHQDRVKCRVLCGADMNVVMEGVLQFFSFEIPTLGNMV